MCKRKRVSRIISGLLCLVLTLGLLGTLPGSTLKAEAAGTTKTVKYLDLTAMSATMSGSVTIDGRQMMPLSHGSTKIGRGNQISIGGFPFFIHNTTITYDEEHGYNVTHMELLSMTSVGTGKWGTSSTNATNMWSTVTSTTESSAMYRALSSTGVLNSVYYVTKEVERDGDAYKYIADDKGRYGNVRFYLPSGDEWWNIHNINSFTSDETWTRTWSSQYKQPRYATSWMQPAEAYSKVHPMYVLFNINLGNYTKNVVFNYSMPDSSLELDSAQTVVVQPNLRVANDCEVIYAYSNSNANKKANRLSLMVTDTPWEEADSKVLDYKVVADEVKTLGKVVFTLPDDHDESQYVYLIAEQKNSGNGYASYPTLVDISSMEVQEGNGLGGATNQAPPASSVPSNPTINDANNILDPNYEGRVRVDFLKETATFTGTEDYKIQYASIKFNPNTYINNLNPNQWEDATGESEIDLSWVSKSKESALVFKFTDAEGKVIYDMLPCTKQNASLKVGTATTSSAITIKGATNKPDFTGNLLGDSENGYLYFYEYDSKAKTASPVSASAIEWRKGTAGNWIKESEDSVSNYLDTFKKKGSTLYFRTTSDGTTWPSKEVKFSYKKQANAPKVVYNTKDSSVTLKAGQEYQIKVNADEWSDWISVSDAYRASAKKVELAKLYTNYSKNKEEQHVVSTGAVYATSNGSISIKVRTEANSKKGTLASKAQVLTLKAPNAAALTVNAETSSITVSYTDPEDTSKGLTLVNNTENDCEFGIAMSGRQPISWTNLKAGKSVKVSAANYTNRSCIMIRYTGNSKDSRLPGSIVEFKIESLNETDDFTAIE